jgi:hypothetical protein
MATEFERVQMAEILAAEEREREAAKPSSPFVPPRKPPVVGKPAGISRKEFEAMLVQIIAGIRREIITEFLPPILRRLAELEARPQLAYRGVWRHAENYPAGSLTTHASALWYAERATDQKPGDSGDSGWKLILKADRHK